MNLLLYANGKNENAERVKNVIKSIVPEKQTEVCPTIDRLSRKLRRLQHGVGVAVLLAATREELLEIYTMKDLFDGIRIILILPDRKSDTILWGHKLFPRYLSYADGNLTDVAAVLEKMLKRMNDNNIYPKGGENKWQS